MTAALIVCGGGFQGLSVHRFVKAMQGGRSIVFDSLHDNIMRHVADDYLIAPPLSAPKEFEEALLSACRRRDARLVLPSGSRELPILAELRSRAGREGIDIAVSEPSLIGLLTDKTPTYTALARAGLPILPPLDPAAMPRDPWPVIGKPRKGWGSTGLHLVNSSAEWLRVQACVPVDEFCWQEAWRDFLEFSADFAISADGRLSPLTLRRRIRTVGGFAVLSESVDDPELLMLFSEVGGWLASEGGRGLFNAQALRSTRGRLVVSDVNPRIGTSSVHALGEGNNLLEFYCHGSEPHWSASPRALVRMVRVLEESFIPLR
jgi:hypothetical protein